MIFDFDLFFAMCSGDFEFVNSDKGRTSKVEEEEEEIIQLSLSVFMINDLSLYFQ